MDRVLLDTDIFSEVLKKKDQAVAGQARVYRARHGSFTLSAATVMENVQGLCRLNAKRQLETFLGSLDEAEVVPVDQDIAVLAGRIDGALLQLGITIGVNDVIIAATAIQLDVTLVTGNTEHYEHVRNVGYPLTLGNWRNQ